MKTAAKAKDKLKIGFLMDPIESINLKTDTTFVLMLEAQARKHRLFYFTPPDLRIENGIATATMNPVTVRRPNGGRASHFTLGEPQNLPLSQLDLIFMRVDPPYNLEYVTLAQTLALVPPPTVVINHPRGLLAANEKFMALRFAEFMPQSVVTQDPERLNRFLEEVGGAMIVKPLSGFGGEGVLLVETGRTNRRVIIESATRNGHAQVMAQKYLPVMEKGDKRIILLSGEPIGAVLRMPAPGDHRANLHSGGSYHKTEITPRDREICAAVGAWAKREGLWLVGVDIVAGHLTEVNVTSPTLVQQINEVENVKLEERILDFSEYLAATARQAAQAARPRTAPLSPSRREEKQG